MYARKIADRTLTIGVSGNLWRDVLVLYDRETDSLWTQLSGRAIRGPMAGKVLEEIPSEMTTWSKWKARHPDTVVLKKDRKLEGSRYARYAGSQEMLGAFGTKNPDPRLGGKDLVYGVKLPGGRAVAVAASRLEQDGGVATRVGDTTLLMTQSPAGGVVAHLLPGGAGEGPPAVKQADGTWKLPDGSVLDPASGAITAGPGRGGTLERLPVTRAYWFAWASFYPRSEIVATTPLQ